MINSYCNCLINVIRKIVEFPLSLTSQYNHNNISGK